MYVVSLLRELSVSIADELSQFRFLMYVCCLVLDIGSERKLVMTADEIKLTAFHESGHALGSSQKKIGCCLLVLFIYLSFLPDWYS